MDFQTVVDAIHTMACVVSVEKFADGTIGKFRIVTGNRAYIDSIENPAPGTAMLTDKFTPNSEYTEYLTRDLNFEDYCYRAAVDKKFLHSYVNPERIPVWFNMSFIPLDADEGDLYYCIYTMEINLKAETENISTISGEMASNVLETCIKLRGASDFKEAMKDVIKDIGLMCEAEHTCILIIDDYNMECEVLCEYLSEGTSLSPMGKYLNREFYDIAKSWEDTIGGSNCLIMKNDNDRAYVKEKNPIWYESISSAGGKSIVLFPLRAGKDLIGYMWAINFNEDNAAKIKETLELTTFIIASEIANFLLIDRLKIASTRDMLTGVMNRNIMNNYIPDLFKRKVAKGKSIGVIFADVNGLKVANDAYGHTAGDIILKNAGNALKEVFDEEQIFRSGGDEFAIIIEGATEADINKGMEDIMAVQEKYDKLFFSVGGSVASDGKEIHTALKFAYERMYKDKQKYYELHPEQKRASAKDMFNL